MADKIKKSNNAELRINEIYKVKQGRKNEALTRNIL